MLAISPSTPRLQAPFAALPVGFVQFVVASCKGSSSPLTRALRISAIALTTVLLGEDAAWAQTLCIPGTPFCARTNGNAGVQAGGAVQAQADPSRAGASANGYANANSGANAASRGNATMGGTMTGQAHGGVGATGQVGGNATGQAGANVGVNANGHGYGTAQTDGQPSGDGRYDRPRRYHSTPTRFGAGVTFCGTVKAGVFSGIKLGPCFAVSFRTELLTFEMESQLLFGGVRHSVDWVFPMSFVIPLTKQRSLYEGLQLRVGGSPIGVTFAKANNGGNYLRFGLHAGVSYEYDLGPAASFRIFDARAFLDFGTRREVDHRDNFLDFGGQLSTGIVF